jgi:hypothetical protein
VKLGESAKLFVAGAAWKAGSQAAGRLLVGGLASTDENNRLIAGMLLVRGGRRAIPLLEQELEHPRNLPMLLHVMGDVAPDAFKDILERFAADSDPQVSRAARDALKAGQIAK